MVPDRSIIQNVLRPSNTLCITQQAETFDRKLDILHINTSETKRTFLV